MYILWTIESFQFKTEATNYEDHAMDMLFYLVAKMKQARRKDEEMNGAGKKCAKEYPNMTKSLSHR